MTATLPCCCGCGFLPIKWLEWKKTPDCNSCHSVYFLLLLGNKCLKKRKQAKRSLKNVYFWLLTGRHLCIDSSFWSLSKFGCSLRLMPWKLRSLNLPMFSSCKQVTDSISTWECKNILNLHVSKLLHWLQTLVYSTMNYESKNTILSKLAERFCELWTTTTVNYATTTLESVPGCDCLHNFPCCN